MESCPRYQLEGGEHPLGRGGGWGDAWSYKTKLLAGGQAEFIVDLP